MRKQIVNKELLLSLPNEVKDMKLPQKANEIYCHLFAFADKNGMCYSTIEGLSKELNCSKTTIITSIKLLEIKKLIIERVIGKRGTATTFKIKLFNSTESCNDTVSLNKDTEYSNSTESLNNNDTESFNVTNEVILLKINELKNEILFELKKEINELKNEILFEIRSLINSNSTIKQSKIKKIKIKQSNNKVTNTNSSNNIEEVNNKNIDNNLDKKNILIDIDKKEEINKKDKKNIELVLNKDIDKSTCKYRKRKKNDYEFTLEEEDDYNQIVEETKVEGILSKSEGKDSKTKKFFYSLKDSSLTFNSYTEALKYSTNNNLNFDENFNKVEVLV